MDFKKKLQIILCSVALTSAIAIAPCSFAQEVVAPLSTPPAITEWQAASASSSGALFFGTSTPIPSSNLRWGPINFRPHVSYRYLYGNGIQASPGNPKKTEIHSFSPGLSAELGAHWTMDYTAAGTYYSSSAFRDTVNQTGQINWTNKYEEWTLSAGQTYSRSDSPTVETGSQTQQTSYVSSFNALVDLNRRYALQTTLSQSINLADGYSNNTRTWLAGETLLRQISARLNAGLGATYSYTAIDKSPDIANIQLLGNLNWRVANKLNISLQGGLDRRHIYNKAGTSKQNPVYSGTIQYSPVATTQLGITASRSSSASFFTNQIIESTSYGLTLSQRLLQRLQFSAALNHQESDYSTTNDAGTTDRSDKIDSFNLGLSTTFRTRIRTGLSYQYSRNVSSMHEYEFSSSQISVEISYSF